VLKQKQSEKLTSKIGARILWKIESRKFAPLTSQRLSLNCGCRFANDCFEVVFSRVIFDRAKKSPPSLVILEYNSSTHTQWHLFHQLLKIQVVPTQKEMETKKKFKWSFSKGQPKVRN